MDPLIQTIVLVVFPYLAVLLLLVGLANRGMQWRATRRITLAYEVTNPNRPSTADWVKGTLRRIFLFYEPPNMEGDRLMRYGSVLFHYGIWVSLLGHLSMLAPTALSPGLHDVLAYNIGAVAGTVALVGLLLLLVRRTYVPKVRLISYIDDYFALALVLALTILGVVQAAYQRPDFLGTVSPWLISILTLHPEVTTLAAANLVTQLHVVLAILFVAYLPYGKLMHAFGVSFLPSIATEGIRPRKGVLASGGGGSNLPGTMGPGSKDEP
jgi:nitrate reductase gamma subunit